MGNIIIIVVFLLLLLLLLLFLITPYTGSTQTTQTQTAKIHLKYKNVNTDLKATTRLASSPLFLLLLTTHC